MFPLAILTKLSYYQIKSYETFNTTMDQFYK